MARAEVRDLCLKVKGFPSGMAPESVAQCILQTTGVLVDKVAPTSDNDTWIILPRSQNDKTRLFDIGQAVVQLEENGFQLYFDFPSRNQIPNEQDWIHTKTVEDEGINNEEDSEIRKSQEHTRQYFLRVSELPIHVTEQELRDFFQDRSKCGGGLAKRVLLNAQLHTADIYFDDSEIIQRVMQRVPLLIEDKKVKVEIVSEKHQEENRVVQIRGIEKEDVEICTLFLETPKKGGGNIVNSNWNDQRKILYITFEDPKVAENVVTSIRHIAGKNVEITFHDPVLEEKSPESCTVEVRGFDLGQKELYMHYFENPNKGGGDIVDLSMNEDNTLMFITFETHEVAERVCMKSPHTVGGRELQVTLAPKEDLSQPCTVMIKGCDPEQKELVTVYFESPKNGGGDIKDVNVDKKQNAIFITFEDAKVAEAVCEREHRIGGRKVGVTLHKAQTTREKRAEEEDAPLRTVEVNVGSRLENEDTYMLYFESRRSGGGDVEKIEIDKGNGVIFVTFLKPEDAERVTGRKHTINGQHVDAKLYVPPKPRPTYSDKLLVRNVKDTTTRDCLTMYLESITGQEPQDLIYSEEPGVVLVTFPEELNFNMAHEKCQKKKLDEQQLCVSKVPISNCLMVERLSPETTNDTVEMYFESEKRSNGGRVEKLELDSGKGCCLVFFEDHEVIDRVLNKQHTIDGQRLLVKRYMECLGPSGGSREGNVFSLPKTLILKDLDQYKMFFVCHSPRAQKSFTNNLHQYNAKVVFVDGALTVECTLTPAVPKAHQLARTWAQDVPEAVRKYLDAIVVLKIAVIQDIWPLVEKEVSGITNINRDNAAYILRKEETVVIVVGIKNHAEELFQQISTTVRDIEQDVERKKQEIRETNKNLKQHQLRLLDASSFQSCVQKRYEGLTVDIRLDKEEIVFHGLLKDVKDAQLEMFSIIQSLTSNDIKDMSPSQKEVLVAKETQQFIYKKFETEKIVAVWEEKKDATTVYALKDSDVVKAVHIIRKSIVQNQQTLTPESAQLLNAPEWQDLMKDLMNKNPGILNFKASQDGKQICITGTDDIMNGVMEEVQRFIEENTIYFEIYCFSPSRQKFVGLYCKDKLLSMASSLKAYKVNVNVENEDREICVKGTARGLDLMKEKLREFGESIVCHVKSLRDQAKLKFLTSENYAKDLDILGRSNQCVLSLTEEPHSLEVLQSQSGARKTAGQFSHDLKTIWSVQLPSGVVLSAVHCDLTQMQCDVIVNAANGNMHHNGGLAKHIVDKGGKTIQEESYQILKSRGGKLSDGEVLVTGPGTLPCKTVIHAVGPVYNGGHRGEEDYLYETVLNCLETTNSHGYVSIAIPAISSGIFCYPVADSTRVVVEAVKNYLDTHRRSTIQTVYLCDISPDTVQHFSNVLQKMYPSRLATSEAFTSDKTSAGFTTMTSESATLSSNRNRHFSVNFTDGEMAKQKADVIVNSVSCTLDLNLGAVSASILAAAGSDIQMECTSKYPDGVMTGDLVRTAGYRLDCKEVFHIVLSEWKNPQASQILDQLMTKCLDLANESHYTTIAFPVLGTGILGFPLDVVIKVMLGAIDRFNKITSSLSITEIRIVIYKNDRVIQEFTTAYNQSLSQIAAETRSSKIPVRSRQNRSFGSQDNASSLSIAYPTAPIVFDVSGLSLQIKQGDITDEDVEAIVHFSNAELDLSSGAVSTRLKSKCGKCLEEECKQKAGDFKDRGIAVTKAHNLKSKRIIHVSEVEFVSKWEKGIEAILKEAEDRDLHSLAISTLGADTGIQQVSELATALFNKLVSYTGSQSKQVQEVRVVLLDRNMITVFMNAMQTLEEKYKKSNKGGLLNWIKGKFGHSSVDVETERYKFEETKLFVYATDSTNVQNAMKAFSDLITDKIVKKTMDDKDLSQLNIMQLHLIEQIAKELNVDIQRLSPGTIEFEGLQKNVFEAWQRTTQILKDTEKLRQEEQAAKLVAELVQWYFIELTTVGNELTPYELKENYLIETAHKQKEKSVEFTDVNGCVYVIDFDVMKEYPKHDATDTVDVIRKDKISASNYTDLPSTWAPTDKDLLVNLVSLQKSDAEYQEVEKNFLKTLIKQKGNVVAIDRVQNSALYRQYQAKKTHLEKQNPGIQNEKTLWHGTAYNTTENINLYGFNRSYCGKNATVHGQGVYFAVESDYSAASTYSPPDPSSGKRYIYQCKVLVGHATRSDPQMRVLPARAGTIAYDSATDDLHKPNMYIIFNDTQAYPEYLITFT